MACSRSNEKPRILVNCLPLPAGAATLALDPPDLRLDRRHVLIVDAEIVVHHATMTGPSGALSPFRRFAFHPPAAIAILPGGSARGYVVDSRASTTGMAAWWVANGTLAVAQTEAGRFES